MEGIKINGSGMDKERDGWARGGEEDVDEGCVKVLCEWCVCVHVRQWQWLLLLLLLLAVRGGCVGCWCECMLHCDEQHAHIQHE